MSTWAAPGWAARWQALWLQAWLTAPEGTARAGALAGLAALVGAGVPWMQGLGLQADLAAQRQQVQALQARSQAQAAALAERQARAATALAPPAWPATHWPQQAQAAGLQVAQFKWTEGDATRAGQVQLRLQGSYAQHLRFVAALARQGVRLVGFQLQAGARGQHGAEVLLASTPGPATEGPDLLAGLAPLENRPDPLSPPPPPRPDPWAGLPEPWRSLARQAPGVLQAAPLADFELVGTLEREGRWLALLRWQGRVHTLGEGEALGSERVQVHRIAEPGIWLREPVRDAQGRWTERERPWRVGAKP